MPEPLLAVDSLSVAFGRRPPAVRDVGFTVAAGERVGIIGESGSGKSVTALAIMGLLAENAQTTGSVRLNGRELLGESDRALSRLRGRDLAMVFQEPMTALDPTMTAGRQVAEVLLLHAPQDRRSARVRVLDMLASVGLADAERVADAFPHQLSGGQRQRVVLAMAMINSPGLLICDEPTTALDVTVQARVLTVLAETLDASGAGCLFISHDLAVVAQVCRRVLVMLGGQIIEQGPLERVFGAPGHPYTRGLVATARIDQVAPGERLPVVEDYFREPR